jgi:hypothetical protein
MSSNASTVVQEKRPPTQRPRTRRKDLKMGAPLNELYLNNAKAIRVLYDLRDPDACKHLHEQRAIWQERSDIKVLDEDHFVLVVWPGVLITTDRDGKRG